MMGYQLNHVCEHHPDPFDCPDALIEVRKDGSAGLMIHDGGHAVIRIKHCPWCGAKLKKEK
jgi:hypothetical protein